MVLVLISGVFTEVYLATDIMALTPVSCYYMASLNYGGNKASDEDHLSSMSKIMSDSIFYDSMGWGLTCSVFSWKGDKHCLPQHKRDGFSCLIIITPMDLGKS